MFSILVYVVTVKSYEKFQVLISKFHEMCFYKCVWNIEYQGSKNVLAS